MISKEQGIIKEDASDEVIYRIEVAANRYDLLCLEGLVRGLLIFLEKEPVPKYRITQGSQKIIVKPAIKQIRPFTVGAVLRGVSFNDVNFRTFIDLQDKLHQNVCRQRTLVSIGTHDLDTIKGPFIYDAQKPDDICFIPLKQTMKYTAVQLMDLYSKDNKLKAFLSIIKDKPLYPIYYDQDKTVMSFPPIINSEHSKITLNTKNVFIEITATDKYKASLVLDTLVCMFSEYCRDKFSIESVEVTYEEDGTKEVYPKLATRTETIDADTINRGLGTELSSKEITKLLSKMGFEACEKDKKIEVNIPPTRQDILHPCDIVEDVGVAFGFNNIPIRFPKVLTVGSQLTINKVCDQVRHEIARCGFTEALTFALCSKEDMEHLHRKESPVVIANPKTIDFQIARTSLLAGLLKTLSANKKMPLPLKVFEIADVVIRDDKTEVGSRNERRLSAVYLGKTPGFEFVHGLLDRVMKVLDIPFGSNGYHITASSDPSYLEGRCAQILIGNQVVGVMGVLHPNVINNFDLSLPASAFEVNMEVVATTHLSLAH